MKGTFKSGQALYKFIPEHMPRPVTFCLFNSPPDIYFYMVEFVEMDADTSGNRVLGCFSLYFAQENHGKLNRFTQTLDMSIAAEPVKIGYCFPN